MELTIVIPTLHKNKIHNKLNVINKDRYQNRCVSVDVCVCQLG